MRRNKLVFKSINLSPEAVKRVEDYRRRCKDRIPSFSEVINQLILDSELLTDRESQSKVK